MLRLKRQQRPKWLGGRWEVGGERAEASQLLLHTSDTLPLGRLGCRFPNLGLVVTSSRRDPPERLGVGPGPHPLLIADDAEIDLAIVPDDELVVNGPRPGRPLQRRVRL
jgi:hypothetical protein